MADTKRESSTATFNQIPPILRARPLQLQYAGMYRAASCSSCSPSGALALRVERLATGTRERRFSSGTSYLLMPLNAYL